MQRERQKEAFVGDRKVADTNERTTYAKTHWLTGEDTGTFEVVDKRTRETASGNSVAEANRNLTEAQKNEGSR